MVPKNINITYMTYKSTQSHSKPNKACELDDGV